ncbi:DeoR family transcriptional regulator [Dactylosporangium sucinum]|uniref:DeoR family transcriptional regulator n=1 Tax=Dactylosporangium sucinum TaxID=1424081 RepID=UPI00167E54DB|nr:DeoR family transcriptional regulator [Dactylosporangium sucinum]
MSVRHDEAMLPAVRHRRILELLAQREYVTVTEVSDATGASLATTQRDLARLATSGALTRIRGGATRSPGQRGDARLLATCLARVRHALDRHDLGAAEHALHQALEACERLRRYRSVDGTA